MNPTLLPWLIVLAAAVAFIGFGVAVDYGLRRGSRRLRGRTIGALWLGGAALVWFALAAGSRHRRVTLHEVILEGTSGGDVAGEPESARLGEPRPRVGETRPRVVEFSVVHPGSEHLIEIVPEYPVGTWEKHRPGFPVSLYWELQDDGGKVLASGDPVLVKSIATDRNWDVERVEFVPRRNGVHRLRLELRTANIPGVRVRVIDPRYRKGRRVEGY